MEQERGIPFPVLSAYTGDLTGPLLTNACVIFKLNILLIETGNKRDLSGLILTLAR